MRINFLVGTLGRGGAEKQLIYMLRSVQSAGIETRILCLTQGESYESEIESLGIDVEWVGKSQNRLMRLYEIVRKLKNNKPDVLQSSHFYTNIYAGLAGKFLKIPSIGAIRNDFISEIKLHKYYGKWQVSLPRFLIANSDAAYQNALERGISAQKIAFVRNVVETNGNRRTQKSGNEVTILFVGRLHQSKRPDNFIRLACILTEKYPTTPLRFLIAGDGELRNQLENLANDRKLSSDKLEFLGICRDMNNIYRQANILVSTSAHEGTPNVILEAMAHGLPVIATNVGGTPEILNEKRGILVEFDNEVELVNAAEKLILDKDLRQKLGSEGQNYVKDNHSLNYLKEKLSGIYEKLLKQKNRNN